MPGDLEQDVNKAVEHVKEALKTPEGNLSKVIQDLQEDMQKRGAQDKTFEQALNKALHDQGLLPKMNIEGADDKGHMVVSNRKGDRTAIMDENQKVLKVEDRKADAEPAKAGDKPAEPAKAGDKPAEPAKAGDKPAEPEKAGDKPAEPAKAGDKPVDKGDVTKEGDVTITKYKDGFTVKDYPDGSQVEMNEKGQVTFCKSAPPQSASRFFKYDEKGEVSAVQGMDGDRWYKDPKNPNLWVSEGGQRWQGKVTGVDKDGNAHYAPEGKAPFTLTREGRVVQEGQGGQGAAGGDAHGRHQGGDQGSDQGGDRARDEAERKAKEEADRKAAEEAAKKAQKPYEGKNFGPSGKEGDIFNPVAPQGMGEFAQGEKVDSEKSGIDYRNVEEKINADGSKTYKYEGEIEDSGLMPWNWGDTNFTGEETFDKEGKLVSRKTEYDGGKDMKFKTDKGEEEIKSVQKVETKFNKDTGNYDTTITTTDGQIYHAETGQDGKVSKIEKASTEKQTDSPGETGGNADKFKRVEDNFNPVRPKGLGELNPGQASSGEKNGIDWRESTAEKSGEDTVYHYKGELEDSGLMPWNWGDTNYEASEKVDKNGKMIETHVKYDSAVDQNFVGPNGQKVEIAGVTKVDTVMDKDGNYVTSVTGEGGKVTTFKTSADGRVVDMKKPQ